VDVCTANSDDSSGTAPAYTLHEAPKRNQGRLVIGRSEIAPLLSTTMPISGRILGCGGIGAGMKSITFPSFTRRRGCRAGRGLIFTMNSTCAFSSTLGRLARRLLRADMSVCGIRA